MATYAAPTASAPKSRVEGLRQQSVAKSQTSPDSPLADESEFIALLNPSDETLDLTGWEIKGLAGADDGPKFFMPAGTHVPPLGYVLVVDTGPNEFRVRYAIVKGVPVVGPHRGPIDDDGERLTVSKPVADGSNALTVVDTVHYGNREPWPLTPDGDGATLERIRAEEFGEDVFNWGASQQVGGTSDAHNHVSPPLILATGLQIPGDITQDGRVNIADPIQLLGHLV